MVFAVNRAISIPVVFGKESCIYQDHPIDLANSDSAVLEGAFPPIG
jgi:hypothetical protein